MSTLEICISQKGNVHYPKVYVDDKDMEDLKFLASKGINVYIQDVPGDPKTQIEG